jgi:transposase
VYPVVWPLCQVMVWPLSQREICQNSPMLVPGRVVAETGADMTRFPTAAHLAAWAGVAPAMNESAGRQTPAGKRHGNKWVIAMLVEAAGSVGRMPARIISLSSTPG